MGEEDDGRGGRKGGEGWGFKHRSRTRLGPEEGVFVPRAWRHYLLLAGLTHPAPTLAHTNQPGPRRRRLRRRCMAHHAAYPTPLNSPPTLVRTQCSPEDGGFVPAAWRPHLMSSVLPHPPTLSPHFSIHRSVRAQRKAGSFPPNGATTFCRQLSCSQRWCTWPTPTRCVRCGWEGFCAKDIAVGFAFLGGITRAHPDVGKVWLNKGVVSWLTNRRCLTPCSHCYSLLSLPPSAQVWLNKGLVSCFTTRRSLTLCSHCYSLLSPPPSTNPTPQRTGMAEQRSGVLVH